MSSVMCIGELQAGATRLRTSTALILTAVFAAGCSSDFSRFSSEFVGGGNQQLVASSNQSNAYPGYDPVNTASVDRALRPIGELQEGQIFNNYPVASAAPYDPNSLAATPSVIYGQNGNTATIRQSPARPVLTNPYPVSYPTPPSYPTVNPYPVTVANPASTTISAVDPAVVRYTGSIQRSTLPALNASSGVRQAPAIVNDPPTRLLPPVANTHQPLPVSPNHAPLVTTAISNPPVNQDGWSAIGGTTITLRRGETLYNVSKRYGVPVNEIARANNISDPSNVADGRKIIIPTYVYSRSSAVSAPDSDPGTKAARASTGMIGEPAGGVVPHPLPRPNYQSAPLTEANKPVVAVQSRGRSPIASNVGNTHSASNRSIITGSIDTDRGRTGAGAYTVQSGDTLSAIARRNKVTVNGIKVANALNSNTIRVGQKLIIPQQGSLPTAMVQARSGGADQFGIDPITTGNTSPNAGNSTSMDTPKATGIAEFRWPVRGRVIHAFGEKIRGERNDGINISVPEGTIVKAAENGVVIYAGNELAGFGNLVLVRHENGWVSAYAHNRDLTVSRGDKVRRGQTLARSGRTGNAEIPMLHFELRKDSNPVNPVDYLSG